MKNHKTTRSSFPIFLTIILFFYGINVYSQDSTHIKNNRFQFHINWIANHYSFFNPWSVNGKITQKHLFLYNKTSIGNEKGWYYNENNSYNFYFAGIGFLKYYKDNIYLKLRFDHFYYNQTFVYNSNYHPENPINGYVAGYQSSYDYTLKSWLITPGVGYTYNLKPFSFSFGAELPLYLRGNGKGISVNIDDTYYYYYDTVQHIQFEKSQVTANILLDRGGYFIGISLFGNIEVNILRRIALGIEGSGGVIYYRSWEYESFKQQLGIEDNAIKIKPLFHYPSVFLSYKF